MQLHSFLKGKGGIYPTSLEILNYFLSLPSLSLFKISLPSPGTRIPYPTMNLQTINWLKYCDEPGSHHMHNTSGHLILYILIIIILCFHITF